MGRTGIPKQAAAPRVHWPITKTPFARSAASLWLVAGRDFHCRATCRKMRTLKSVGDELTTNTNRQGNRKMARYKLTPEELANTEPGDCTTCGKPSPSGRNTIGQCTACHNAGAAEYRNRRKRQLADMPRCEVTGCNRRANYTAGHSPSAGICGRHLKLANAKLASQGIFGMLGTAGGITGSEVIALAEAVR